MTAREEIEAALAEAQVRVNAVKAELDDPDVDLFMQRAIDHARDVLARHWSYLHPMVGAEICTCGQNATNTDCPEVTSLHAWWVGS